MHPALFCCLFVLCLFVIVQSNAIHCLLVAVPCCFSFDYQGSPTFTTFTTGLQTWCLLVYRAAIWGYVSSWSPQGHTCPRPFRPTYGTALSAMVETNFIIYKILSLITYVTFYLSAKSLGIWDVPVVVLAVC